MLDPQAGTVDRILRYARRIAVVGLSPRPWRESHSVSARMQRWGFEIVPVNPFVDEVLGVKAYPSLADVPGVIDLVNVFRRDEHLVGVAGEAVEVGARGLWLQLGLESPGARAIALAAGLDYVEDRCIQVEVAERRQRPAS